MSPGMKLSAANRFHEPIAQSDERRVLQVLKRVLLWLLSIPAAIFLVTLAVANRHVVTLILDPFNPQEPAISLPLPFYLYLFGALITGVILGGVATWMTQGKWRQTARKRTQEAMRWQAEADRLTRERDAQVSSAKRLTAS